MQDDAARFGEETGYQGAGTVEYLFDPAAGSEYLLEMNTRIEVEQLVTEPVTGYEIVRAELLRAPDDTLRLRAVSSIGDRHAIECRVNAEAPELGFRPFPGRVTQ